MIFLLTHLSRGVTDIISSDFFLYLFLLTHLSRGVTPTPGPIPAIIAISTHTPLARCDADGKDAVSTTKIFLLTHLSRGVTLESFYMTIFISISTHTPLARCDGKSLVEAFPAINFYSHTSREV